MKVLIGWLEMWEKKQIDLANVWIENYPNCIIVIIANWAL